MLIDMKRKFSCGIDSGVFQAKYEQLAEADQYRLRRVAQRMDLTLKLRYELAVYRNPLASPEDEFSLNHIELPALEIYLLVTCLDTLAGQAYYIEFDDWMKRQPDFGQLDVQAISDLFSAYQEEYGVNKNFRKLFQDLPNCVKEWLAQNVSIREVDTPSGPEVQDLDLLAQNLCTYFFDLRRSDYTHSSFARQVSLAEDIFLPLKPGWWVTPAVGTHFILNRRKSRKLWGFSYRQGLDEATILRLIIHSAVLEKLGIEVTQELIHLNLKNYSRLDGLYAFKGEVTSNSNLLSSWQRIDDARTTDFGWYLMFHGLPPLSEEASRRMIGRYESQQGWEQSFKQFTEYYLHEVLSFNAVINHFNQENPPLSSFQGNLDKR